MRLRRIGAILLALLLVSLSTANAQERYGTITGTVRDQGGLVLPGVSVKVTNRTTQRSTDVVTDSEGVFFARSLEPGRYSVKFELSGFVPAEAPDVILLLGATANVDTSLKVGGVTETVQVLAETPLIDIGSTTRSRNIPAEEFDAIPKGRSFQSLAAALPSVNTGELEGGTQVNGASAGENVYTVDGVSVVSQINGGQRQDAVFDYLQEVQVKTTGFQAEYGGAMGGVVSAVTKSGGNQFHGGAYEYFSANWLRPDNGVAQRLVIDPISQNSAAIIQDDDQTYSRNEFGGTLGGPIVKDKLFFFGSISPRIEKLSRNYGLADGTTSTIDRDYRNYSTFGKVTVNPSKRLTANVSGLWTPTNLEGSAIAYDGATANTSVQTASALTSRQTLGWETPQYNIMYNADYTLNDRTVISARGGYFHDNYFDTGVDKSQTFEYGVSAIGLPFTSQIPAQYQQPSGFSNLPRVQINDHDITSRNMFDVSVTRLASFAGQHQFKGGFGYLRATNDVELAYPNGGYVTVFWNQTYTSDVPGIGSGRGTYGYYTIDNIGTTGKTGANILDLFVQDNWTVTPKLTLNLGVRTEHEDIPSFRPDIQKTAISFGWGEKIAPRLGAAYNVFGDDRLKISGSYGIYYDFTKYELARGTFGGDTWTTRYRTLDDPDPSKLSLANLTGTNLWDHSADSYKDSRIPSFGDDVVDPDMKPMAQQTYNIGAEYQLGRNTVVGANFVRSDLLRTIEDIGFIQDGSEVYIYGNPGSGIATTETNTSGLTPAFPLPKAKRQYTAVELTANRRFHNSWFLGGSYVISHLYGNYPGLVNTDEVTYPGRVSVGAQEGFGQRTRPGTNASRAFDFDQILFDSHGNIGVDGDLPTDRPNSFKLYGSYLFKTGTNVGLNFRASSGTPRTETVQSSLQAPLLVEGRGNLGRTPTFSQTDLLLSQTLKMAGDKRISLEFNVINLFNQRTAIHFFDNLNRIAANGRRLASSGLDLSKVNLLNGYDYLAILATTPDASKVGVPVSGYQDPRYGQADMWQPGTDARISVRFSF